MKFLVDANVLSEPTKPVPNLSVLAWLRRHEGEVAIDPVILGELRYGILLLAPGKRRRSLERPLFETQIVESGKIVNHASPLADSARCRRAGGVPKEVQGTIKPVVGQLRIELTL